MRSIGIRHAIVMGALAGLLLYLMWSCAAPSLGAHCDTIDGPVVTSARRALTTKRVEAVLPWVKPEHEREVREAFEKSIALRAGGPDIQALSDVYFFETVVRLHRQDEGAGYTGLKPAGSGTTPAIRAADQALEAGSVDALIDLVTRDAVHGIRERFMTARRLRAHADESVDSGRAAVAAYIAFVHYVERLHQAAQAAGSSAPLT